MIFLALLIFQNPGGTLLAIALYIGIGSLFTGIILLISGIHNVIGSFSLK